MGLDFRPAQLEQVRKLGFGHGCYRKPRLLEQFHLPQRGVRLILRYPTRPMARHCPHQSHFCATRIFVPIAFGLFES